MIVQGVEALGPRASRAQRIGTLGITGLPFLGLAVAAALLWGRGLNWLDVALFLAFYVVTGLGVAAGYHRLFTHQSFVAVPALKAALAIAGSMSLEGSLISWVAAHRRHHAYSDREGDPHSPHLEESLLRGLWHAHMGWLFVPERTDPKRWAPDMLKDRLLVRIDRLFPLWVVLSLGLPAALGGLVSGTWWGALTGLLWGGLVRIFFFHHITWSINSICHTYGKRSFQSSDESTNNWFMALLSFGEGWHNNHHAFPTSVVHGLERYQIDFAALAITAFERLGWATQLRLPTQEQMDAKRIDNGSPTSGSRSSFLTANCKPGISRLQFGEEKLGVSWKQFIATDERGSLTLTWPHRLEA